MTSTRKIKYNDFTPTQTPTYDGFDLGPLPPSEVTIPPAGVKTIFVSSEDGQAKMMDETGAYEDLGLSGDITLGNVVIEGDLVVQGDTTVINTQELTVSDPSIIVNDGGTAASAEGAGLTVVKSDDIVRPDTDSLDILVSTDAYYQDSYSVVNYGSINIVDGTNANFTEDKTSGKKVYQIADGGSFKLVAYDTTSLGYVAITSDTDVTAGDTALTYTNKVDLTQDLYVDFGISTISPEAGVFEYPNARPVYENLVLKNLDDPEYFGTYFLLNNTRFNFIDATNVTFERDETPDYNLYAMKLDGNEYAIAANDKNSATDEWWVAKVNLGSTEPHEILDGDSFVYSDREIVVDGSETKDGAFSPDSFDIHVDYTAGVPQQSRTVIATVQYDSSLTSKWKLGAVGEEKEVVTTTDIQTVENKVIRGGDASSGDSRIEVPFAADRATIEGLARQKGAIYFDDNKKEFLGDDGLEVGALGGGLEVVVIDLPTVPTIEKDTEYQVVLDAGDPIQIDQSVEISGNANSDINGTYLPLVAIGGGYPYTEGFWFDSAMQEVFSETNTGSDKYFVWEKQNPSTFSNQYLIYDFNASDWVILDTFESFYYSGASWMPVLESVTSLSFSGSKSIWGLPEIFGPDDASITYTGGTSQSVGGPSYDFVLPEGESDETYKIQLTITEVVPGYSFNILTTNGQTVQGQGFESSIGVVSQHQFLWTGTYYAYMGQGASGGAGGLEPIAIDATFLGPVQKSFKYNVDLTASNMNISLPEGDPQERFSVAFTIAVNPTSNTLTLNTQSAQEIIYNANSDTSFEFAELTTVVFNWDGVKYTAEDTWFPNYQSLTGNLGDIEVDSITGGEATATQAGTVPSYEEYSDDTSAGLSISGGTGTAAVRITKIGKNINMLLKYDITKDGSAGNIRISGVPARFFPSSGTEQTYCLASSTYNGNLGTTVIQLIYGSNDINPWALENAQNFAPNIRSISGSSEQWVNISYTLEN